MFDRLSPKKLEDEALAKKAQKSEHYFGILYDRRSQKIYAFVRWRVGGDADAYDLVSETFMAVASKLSSFDASKGKFSTRIFSIAYNKLRMHYRSKKKEENTVILDESYDKPIDTDINQLLSDRMLYDQIIQQVKNMSENQSTTFFLRYIQGYSNKEIAEIMDIDQRTVSSTLWRVQNKLKEARKNIR